MAEFDFDIRKMDSDQICLISEEPENQICSGLKLYLAQMMVQIEKCVEKDRTTYKMALYNDTL